MARLTDVFRCEDPKAPIPRFVPLLLDPAAVGLEDAPRGALQVLGLAIEASTRTRAGLFEVEFSQAAAARALGLRRNTIGAALRALEASGRVRIVKGGRGRAAILQLRPGLAPFDPNKVHETCSIEAHVRDAQPAQLEPRSDATNMLNRDTGGCSIGAQVDAQLEPRSIYKEERLKEKSSGRCARPREEPPEGAATAAPSHDFEDQPLDTLLGRLKVPEHLPADPERRQYWILLGPRCRVATYEETSGRIAGGGLRRQMAAEVRADPERALVWVRERLDLLRQRRKSEEAAAADQRAAQEHAARSRPRLVLPDLPLEDLRPELGAVAWSEVYHPEAAAALEDFVSAHPDHRRLVEVEELKADRALARLADDLDHAREDRRRRAILRQTLHARELWCQGLDRLARDFASPKGENHHGLPRA